jgi:hypothetical protein
MSVRRVVTVASGLSAFGAIIGAVCVMIAVAAVLAIRPPHDSVLSLESWLFLLAIAQFGAAIGAVSTPLLGFGIVRRVPMARAAAVIAVATVVGAVAGEFISPLNPYDADIVPGIVRGALVGLVVAGVGLRLAERRARVIGSVDPAV